VRLDKDVEALVLDPCYRASEIEEIAARWPCPIEWHRGFVVSVEDLRQHRDYRGSNVVDLAISLSVDGHLDARLVGEAARSGRHDEQDLKRVWHCVARFGGTF